MVCDMKPLPKIVQFVIEGYMILGVLFIIFSMGFLESEYFDLYIQGKDLYMLIFTIMSIVMIVGVGTIWVRNFMKVKGRLQVGEGSTIEDPMTISTLSLFYAKGFLILMIIFMAKEYHYIPVRLAMLFLTIIAVFMIMMSAGLYILEAYYETKSIEEGDRKVRIRKRR